MSKPRIRYNWSLIRSYPRSERAAEITLEIAHRIDKMVTESGCQSRVDIATGRNRVRAAVIAGYEDGATAENTRRVMLSALDAGGADADSG